MVLAFATLLLIATFVASLLSQRHLDELAVLYVLPATLAGLELGARGGAAAAAIALGLLLVESGPGATRS